ncbi:alcohol dehydrogenase catalytic domain-containing protein [Arthrobacter pascens]|uniref:alcohol dehydrogenase catalytic domain-containing protein n=1 Tax=Arthrobacter pascens TaxID=1677 RepID=UPI00355823FC
MCGDPTPLTKAAERFGPRSTPPGAASAARTSTSTWRGRSSCPPRGIRTPLSSEDAPITIGHEFSGTVSDVREGVPGLAKGTTSSSSPILWTATVTCARRASTTCAGRWASSGCPVAGEC